MTCYICIKIRLDEKEEKKMFDIPISLSQIFYLTTVKVVSHYVEKKSKRRSEGLVGEDKEMHTDRKKK